MTIYKFFDGKFIDEKIKFMPQTYKKFEKEILNLMEIVFWAKEKKEAILCYRKNIQSCPKCENCDCDSVFRGSQSGGGYNRFCDKKNCFLVAASLSGTKEAQNKSKFTSMKNWGVEFPSKSTKVREKINRTYDKNYGGHPFANESVRQEIYKTCRKKFGGDNPMNSQSVRDKREVTWISNYGFVNASSSPVVREKVAKTNQDRYGGNSPLSDPNVIKKYKESCLNNFGYDNPLKSPQVWEKIRDTLEDRYGVRHNMHHTNTSEKANTSNFRDYTSLLGNLYRVQGYEHFAIELLESQNIKFQNNRFEVGTLKYKTKDKVRCYFPDFKLSDKSFIEVKSEYTLNKDITKLCDIINSNESIELIIWVFDKNGNLINNYNKTDILRKGQQLCLM